MKKILFVMFAALAFVACDKDFQSQTEKTDLEAVVQNNKVSLKQALLYAENSVNGINPTTRSTERKVKSTEIYVAKPATRSAEDTEVSFYLINYENNEGFAMVSTDSRATPVYAYSDEGNLTPESFENNPGLQIFRDGAIQHYENEIANSGTYDLGDDRLPIVEIPEILYNTNDVVAIVEVDGTYYFEGSKINEIIKGPLVPVAWHQDMPYNRHYQGHKYAGCGPVAAAQVMSYYKYPTIYDNYTYNWDYMTSVPTHSIHQVDEAYSISKLLEQIAIEANCTHDGVLTLTSSFGLMVALNDFGYNYQWDDSFDSTTIFANIDNNNPVIIGGDKQGEEYGHYWVIDGSKTRWLTTTLYDIEYPYNAYSSTSSTPTKYYHCNWGNRILTEEELEEDPNLTQRTENGFYLFDSFEYNLNLEMFYNIYPKNN